MQKLSGLVLDFYDDQGGEILRSIFPSQEEVPELIKSAHPLTPDELEALPSDIFALELVDGDVCLRKFACTDAGNTALSIEYFFKTAGKLPESAQRVAAENLVKACSWYGIDPPEQLQKLALGMGSLFTLAMAPSVAKGTKQQIDQNMQVARASGSAINPNAAKTSTRSLGG